MFTQQYQSEYPAVYPIGRLMQSASSTPYSSAPQSTESVYPRSVEVSGPQAKIYAADSHNFQHHSHQSTENVYSSSSESASPQAEYSSVEVGSPQRVTYPEDSHEKTYPFNVSPQRKIERLSEEDFQRDSPKFVVSSSSTAANFPYHHASSPAGYASPHPEYTSPQSTQSVYSSSSVQSTYSSPQAAYSASSSQSTSAYTSPAHPAVSRSPQQSYTSPQPSHPSPDSTTDYSTPLVLQQNFYHPINTINHQNFNLSGIINPAFTAYNYQQLYNQQYSKPDSHQHQPNKMKAKQSKCRATPYGMPPVLQTNDENALGKTKKNRTEFTTADVRILEAHFKLSDFARGNKRDELAVLLNVKPRSITIWFQNKRAKLRNEKAQLAKLMLAAKTGVVS